MKVNHSVVICYFVLMPMTAIAAEQNRSVEINPHMSDNWFGNAMEQLRTQEYKPSIQALDHTGKPFAEPRYHFANRAHDLRAYFDDNGIELMPRKFDEHTGWHFYYALNSIYRMDHKNEYFVRIAPEINDHKIQYQYGGLTQEYTNSEAGILQRIIIQQPPEGIGDLLIKTSVQTSNPVRTRHEDSAVSFAYEANEVVYQFLSAQDAAAQMLYGSIIADSNGDLSISIDDARAVYPVQISLLFSTNNTGREPGPGSNVSDLSETPDWIHESNQDSAYYGYSVSTIGDVNGDGYSDVIIGAPLYDFGQPDEGRVFAYYGSDTGLSVTDWAKDENQPYAQYGYSVSYAGDVNGDEFSDVIVGAPYAANGQADEGMAYVYHGGATGLSMTANWTGESNQVLAYYGISVSTAGDVNNDGYSDVIVGAPTYNEGRAFVYHGSTSGLSTNPNWTEQASTYSYYGGAVSTAGDVNGDGYADVIIGAPNYDSGQFWEGQALVYHGSSGGLSSSASWSAEGDLEYARFGWSVSTAGDANGDGYADVIVGSPWYTNGQYEEGRAFIYTGSATGLSASPDWISESNQASAHFGSSVSDAGDVNGDGYSDMIVGAPQYDNGQNDEGRVSVFLGGALSTFPHWIAESDQANSSFGSSVCTAGDVNGDGFSDIIIGAPRLSNGQIEEGGAFVYHGNAALPSTTPDWFAESDHESSFFGGSVSTAGDVNGDGYSDVIVGASYYDNGQPEEGMVFVYHGNALGLSPYADWTYESNQSFARFGNSVSTAGDVNGDGYSDVIVGLPGANHAYVFKGSNSGLSYVNWIGTTLFGGAYGAAVSTAGDVNGDGFSDIIVGASTQSPGGWAYVYHGSDSTLSSEPDWSAQSDSGLVEFGSSVSTAGDVNRDGYSDVIVGAPLYNSVGRTFAYYGSEDGLPVTASWVAEGDVVGARFGNSVSSAGDVNGDGYSDVVIGAPTYNGGQDFEGRVYLYHGTFGGLSLAYSWVFESDQTGAWLGYCVSDAGDVNGDGYSDVIVGAPEFNNGETDEGAAFLFLGTDTLLQGLSLTPAWIGDINQTFAYFGYSVSTAGDVNGDGFSDIIVGAINYDNGQIDEGGAFVYYGNAAGAPIVPRQAVVSRSDIVQLQNATGSSSVRLKVLARTPGGSGKVKLQWEIKELGQPFNGTDLGISNNWYDVQAGGTEISEDITSLQNSTAYHWRARFKYSPDAGNGQVYSRWFSVGPNGMNEKDFITTSLVGVQEHGKLQPIAYTLSVNPNPFTQITDIRYQITDNSQKCELKIYDITGRLIIDLSKQLSVIGYQSSVVWDGTDQVNRKLASGVYFVKLTVDDHNTTEKILLIR